MCVFFFFLFFQIVVVFSASWRRQCGSERVQIALSVPGHGGQAKGKIKICFLLTKVVVVKLFFFNTHNIPGGRLSINRYFNFI